MSFARFSETSDVYVFSTVTGGVECCGCALVPNSPAFYSFEALAEHLREHEAAGHTIPAHLLDPETYDPDDFDKDRNVSTY